MLLAWLIKLYCFLRYGPSSFYFRVYRVTERQSDGISQSIVFENIQDRLFVESSSSFIPISGIGDATSHQIVEVCELSDAICAIERLRIDIPLEVHSKTWKREYSQSIDEAIDKGSALAERLLSRMRGSSIEFGEENSGQTERGLRAYLTLEHGPADESTHEGMIRQLSNELRNKADGKKVRWEYIGNTPAGRERHLLVIEGKEEHHIP